MKERMKKWLALMIIAALLGTVALAEEVEAPAVDAPFETEVVEIGAADAMLSVDTVVLTKNRTVTINVGDTLAIDLNGKTAKSYKSASKKIAKVSKAGVVTAVKEGKTKITVTLSKKKKLVLTVKVADPYKPSSVSLNYSGTVSLKTGTSLTLTPQLSPSTASTTFTWSSSDTKIAKVSSGGVVTPVKPGTATITVKTANGKKASVKVRTMFFLPVYSDRIELMSYLGVKFTTIRKELGVKKLGNKQIWFGSYGEDWSPDYAEFFGITSDPNGKYSIFGIYLGMPLKEAQQRILAMGWEYDEDNSSPEDRSIEYYCDSDDYFFNIQIDYNQNGIVTELYGE